MPALPGGILYATLLTKVNGAWTRYQSASFTAASGGAHFTYPHTSQLNVEILYATVYTEINGGWINYNLVGFTGA